MTLRMFNKSLKLKNELHISCCCGLTLKLNAWLNISHFGVSQVPLKLKNFLESFAFNSQQKTYNLLRGQGSVETKDSGISKQSFQWADYNIVLPLYKTILKHKHPPLSGEGVILSQLQNMLRFAENKSETFFEDNKSKIYLNTMINDEMALKPAGPEGHSITKQTGGKGLAQRSESKTPKFLSKNSNIRKMVKSYSLNIPRVDKWYGDRWSHLCPKKWLFFTNLGQGLSSKVGFFLIF